MLSNTKYTCPIVWDDLFGRIPDVRIITEFADSFIKNSQKLMGSLVEAVSDGDAEQIEMYAHAMKGSASNMGAITLAKAAWKLEKAASENQLDTAAQWLETINTEFQAVNTFLQHPDWIQQAQHTPKA